MNIYRNLKSWREHRNIEPSHRTIGFVPTMGNLHRGHATLINKSLEENDKTVVSIFVNPTQFNQAQDFLHYPRTIENDIELLESLGVDSCLLPSEQELYPQGYRYKIQEREQDEKMEGLKRPGHFTGVLTVVMKLLLLVKPDNVYFGEKDYQQLQLVRGMVEDFFMDIQVIGCPIIREDSGLPCSSRNGRLTPSQRVLADQFATIFQKAAPCHEIIKELEEMGLIVEYLEEDEHRRFVAVKVGDIRLIDNYQLDSRFPVPK